MIWFWPSHAMRVFAGYISDVASFGFALDLRLARARSVEGQGRVEAEELRGDIV